MDQILDKFIETLEFNIQQEFSHYHVKVSQVRGSFCVLIRKPRGKILGETFKNMADDVKYISKKVYRKFLSTLIALGINIFLTLNWLGGVVGINIIF